MKLTHPLMKEQGPMILVLLIFSAAATLALADMAGWEDPNLTGPNMGLRILKRDNLQLSRILKRGDRVPKGHIKVFKRGKYHGISPLPGMAMVFYQSLDDNILICYILEWIPNPNN